MEDWEKADENLGPPVEKKKKKRKRKHALDLRFEAELKEQSAGRLKRRSERKSMLFITNFFLT